MKITAQISFRHGGMDKIALYPPVRGTYAQCCQKLSSAGLHFQTFSELVSFLYSAWETINGDSNYQFFGHEIVRLLNSHWMRCSTVLLYTPKKGLYIDDRPALADGAVTMKERDLVRRLKAGDPAVRFVPYDYQIGEQQTMSLLKNSLIRGLLGSEEQLEKLAIIGEKGSEYPYIRGLNFVDELTVRVAALYGEEHGKRLGIYTAGHGDHENACAFGIITD
jgi:hypothetical protein